MIIVPVVEFRLVRRSSLFNDLCVDALLPYGHEWSRYALDLRHQVAEAGDCIVETT